MRVAGHIALITAVATVAAVGAAAGCAAFRAAEPDAAAGDASANDASASDAFAGDTSAGDARGDAGPEANDGGAADGGDASPRCNSAAACVRHVFMTSTRYLPTQIVNPTTAYGLCSDLVNRGSGPLKGRMFEAWLSVTGNEAKNRLVHGTKPYVSTDGVDMIAASWTALTSGILAHGITQDENGAPLPAGSLAWTGTDADGTGIGDCAGWTSDGLGMGAAGLAGAVDSSWTNDAVATAAACSQALHLLCIEQ